METIVKPLRPVEEGIGRLAYEASTIATLEPWEQLSPEEKWMWFRVGVAPIKFIVGDKAAQQLIENVSKSFKEGGKRV